MQRLFGAPLAIALVMAAIVPAAAADLPAVKISDSNPVPACATPGRLMAYLRERNPRMDDRYDSLATQYMRYGEELGIRWDVAFFQMILETGALTYTGDVRANQNNFAGLGAAGGGKRGEHFPDIATGVKAHLQHLLMYAGEHIDDPVAERTRKVQEWGVLTDWQRSIKGPMTFSLVAQQWAPGSRGYVRDISAITDGFYDGACHAADPHPEFVQEARAGRGGQAQTQVAELAPAQDVDTSATAAAVPAITPEAAAPEKPLGSEIAERSIQQARKEDPPLRSLGASGMLGGVAQGAAKAATAEMPKANAPAAQPEVTVINTPKSQAPDTIAQPEKSKTAAKTETPKPDKTAAIENTTAKAEPSKGAEIQTASVAGAATQLKVPAATKSAKCKVWTASYGGQHAVLIKASTNGTVNYTVLDVNEANEKREVDAYIAAYAKGGQKVAAFPNQTQALDKAFELCPEG